MSWKKNWNRTVEGWVQRRRRFREVSAATIGKLAGVKAPEVSRAVPEPVLATREEARRPDSAASVSRSEMKKLP